MGTRAIKSIILTVLTLPIAMNLFAQQDPPHFFMAPDYDGIKQVIADPDSEFYYPRLMERMKQYDTTLTVADYRALYYGYRYQPGFSQFSMPEQDRELLKYYNNSYLPKRKYDEIIKLIEQALEKDPFYIRGLNFLGYVLHMKGEEPQALKTADRFNKVVQAILSSGDGKTPETSFHVIHAGHEYVVMNFLRKQYGNRKSSRIDKGMCDCFGQGRDQICFYVSYEQTGAF